MIKSHFESKKKGLTVVDTMITGSIAGAATSLITNPIWVLNTRIMVRKDNDSKVKSSAFETAQKIFEEEGIAGFWRGILPALVLVINPVIQYTVFEKLKAWWEKKRGSLNAIDFFCLGAISKLCATAITYPYIVVKSRMQLKESKDKSQEYKSLLDGFKKIVDREGVKGLYKGIESKLLQSVLSAAFTFAFKEELYNCSIWILALLKMKIAK
jgi:adenine nucleotide transporter 17